MSAICRYWGFLCILPLVFAPAIGQAESSNCSPWAATLESLEGQADVRNENNVAWRPAKVGDVFCYGDSLRVTEFRAALRLQNDTLVRLKEGSVVKFLPPKKAFWLQLLDGAAHFISRTQQDFKVEAKKGKAFYVNAAVEGTEFSVSHSDAGIVIALFEGSVLASNDLGSIRLTHMQQSLTAADAAPAKASTIRLQDSVDWALSYPPLFSASASLPDNIEQALKQGDYTQALQLLEGLLDKDALTALDLSAAIALYRGQIALAKRQNNQALIIDANAPASHAIKAMILLVEGKTNAAQSLSLKLLASHPNNSRVLLAHSYAQQAAFKLPEALASAQKALAQDPQQTLLQLRVAELAISNDQYRLAKIILAKTANTPAFAAQKNTLSALVALKAGKNRKARNILQNAAAQNPNHPLTQFALGLVKIRLGHLEAGREKLELAAALDPSNSLYRSYLGKAYFEEGRDELAEEQFFLAKALDSKDPTPWFYQAILQRNQNQPTAALHAIEESIVRNDNRGVYRSRLALDADFAARHASLGSIYLDLGFDELAQQAAAKSLTTDPTNFSAHKLLAESYANEPLLDVARSSEILQAQLLQPLTATPIRSVLAESDLIVVDGTGPSDLGFNEYNSLFNRERSHVQIAGLTGSNSLASGEALASGLYGPVSLALGHYAYKTDGFRENNDIDLDISTAFVQVQVIDNLNIQLEGRKRREDRGDIVQRLLEDAFGPNNREKFDVETLRFGFRYQINSEMDVIGSVAGIDYDFIRIEQQTNEIGAIVDSRLTSASETRDSKIQLAIKDPLFSITLGAENAIIDLNEITRSVITLPPPGPVLPPEIREPSAQNEYNSAYAYWNTRLIDQFLVTLGASFNKIESIFLLESESQWNPKIGVSWDASENFTINAAAFKNIKRPIQAEQTLEPTQVANINQFYDEFEAASSKNIGLAFNYKISNSLHLSTMSLKRDIETPRIGDINVRNSEEMSHQLNINFTRESWYVSVKTTLTDAERDLIEGSQLGNQPFDLKTTSIPILLGINFSSGTNATLRATYLNQEGKFENAPGLPIITRDDEFWILGLTLEHGFWGNNATLSAGVDNIFDSQFQYQDTNFQDNSPRPFRFSPERNAFIRLRLGLSL